MSDESQGLNFNIKLPDKWQDMTAYYFKGPTIDDTDHILMLNIDRVLQTDDINEFARGKIQPIVQSLSSIDVLKDEEITCDGGWPAYEFVFKWALSDDLVEIHKYVFVLKEEFGFSFNMKFSKKTYKMLKTQFKEVIEGLLPETYSI